MKYLGVASPFDVLQLPIPLWAFLTVVILAVSTIYVNILHSYRKEAYYPAAVIRQKPSYNVKEGILKFFGVNWHVFYGSATPWGDAYGFVESGPLCPQCNYEMDIVFKRKWLRKKKYWKCLLCHRLYEYPKNVPDVDEAIAKLVEAFYRQKP